MTITHQLDHFNINKDLIQDKERLAKTNLRQLFQQSNDRFKHYSISAAGLLLDYSKNLLDQLVLDNLVKLAEEANLLAKIKAMFAGEEINVTENRAVLHTALRHTGEFTNFTRQKNIDLQLKKDFQKIQQFIEKIHHKQWRGWTGKPIKHLVHVGIGGSFLGIKTVIDALKPYYCSDLIPHFIVNVDPEELFTVCSIIDPETTLFIIVSKSFNTPETMQNAHSIRQWMLQRGMPKADIIKHFIAISSDIDRVTNFGIIPENIFSVPSWVGGRFSLWSAIGIIIILIIGLANFKELQAGAHAMDYHFTTKPFNKNMPVLLGLIGIWYQNYWHTTSHAILPYSSSLATFVDHLQQLDMESNGKSVNIDGKTVKYNTSSVIWGNIGTNGQHAYHQFLHQGTYMIPVDFIVPLMGHYPIEKQHKFMVANAFAQSQALMNGITYEESKKIIEKQNIQDIDVKWLAKHKMLPGNRPSNTILMKRLTPRTMGALIALYEHKIFVQGQIWQINSFDQWGVELGKILGQKIFQQLNNQMPYNMEDSSTSGLIDHYHEIKKAT